MTPYDANGTIERFKITGGATPTGAIQIDPAITAGWWYVKFQVVNSSNAAVTQSTAARVFTVMVRPL